MNLVTYTQMIFVGSFVGRNSRKLKINHIKFKPLLTDNQVHSKKH